MSDVYYFGCHRQPGHYMWQPGMRSATEFTRTNPWGYKVDSGLCPPDPQEREGRALRWSKDGWTAISFWDRSVDGRGKCNSTFLAKGDFTFDEMVALARQHFPEIVGRFRFEITDATIEATQ